MEEEFIHARMPGYEVRLCHQSVEQKFLWTEDKVRKLDPEPNYPECLQILAGLVRLIGGH